MVLASARNAAGWFWKVPGTQQNISGRCHECDIIILAGARNTTEWFWPVPGMPQDGSGGYQERS